MSKAVLMGWVHRIRVLKRIVFVVVRNRQGLFQCVLTPSTYEAEPLVLECVVKFSGHWQEAQTSLGDRELVVEAVEVLNWPVLPPELQINGPELNINLETLLNHRVLALRHPQEQAIFRINSALVEAFSQALRAWDFVQIFTPKLVQEGAEGGANVFSLDYFGQRAYLAQSPQFYKQMMVIAGFERVFEIGPVFRAEAHSTRRHLNEYTSLDVEMGFITSELDLMQLETELLRQMLATVEQGCASTLAQLGLVFPKVPQVIPTITFDQALALLESEFGRGDLEGDLDPEAERQLGHHFLEATGSDFVFVTGYPASKRPMYTMGLGQASTRSFDLLFRGLEITTGGQRHHEKTALIENMHKKGLNPDQYGAYLKAFDHGVPPHGGFAIGLERLTAQLLGYPNVRRTTAFPRDCERLLP